MDYWVDLLFTDAEGNVATREGLPIWLHSHWVGGGALPTSEWAAGSLMREQYDGLVPRSVAPGTYYLRAYLYEDDQRAAPAILLGTERPDLGALLAVVKVEPGPPEALASTSPTGKQSRPRRVGSVGERRFFDGTPKP